MTIQKIADRVMAQFPHGYDGPMILAWVNDLERVIAEEMTHYVGNENYTFEDHESMMEETQLDRPEMYVPWVISQICLANEEYNRYNNHLAIFQAKYDDWSDEYIRKHMPVYGGKFKL